MMIYPPTQHHPGLAYHVDLCTRCCSLMNALTLSPVPRATGTQCVCVCVCVVYRCVCVCVYVV